MHVIQVTGLIVSMTAAGLIGYILYLCGVEIGRTKCRQRIYQVLQELPIQSQNTGQQIAIQCVSLWVRRELRRDEET